jgi:CPA2 family monovalent cation:H+ antiporter-2
MVASLLSLLAVAAAGLAVGRALRLPPVVAYLVAGVVAGPAGLAVVAQREGIEELAELGVALLLFGVGIEFSLQPLRRALRRMLTAGALQVLVSTIVTALLFRALAAPWPTAIFIGFLVSLSSTALVFKLYADEGSINAPHGEAAAGVLLFQDLALVPMMLLVPVLAGSSEGVLSGAGVAVVQALLAVGGLLVLARTALPRLLALVARTRTPELFPLVALLIAVGTAFGATSLGLSFPLGMFLAGLALSESPYSHQVFAELLPLRDAFVAVFFTSVGLLFRPMLVAADPSGFLLMLGAVVLKGLVCGTVVAIVWRSGRLGVVSGFALAQIGEFSFVLSREGTEVGLLAEGLGQAFLGAAVVSMAATPFLIRAGRALAAAGAERPGASAGPPDHVVVVGYGTTGQAIAHVLRETNLPFTAVDLDPRQVERGKGEGIPIRFGDASRRAVLESMGAADARAAVVAVRDPIATRRIVSLLRQLNPRARILVRAHRVTELDELERLGATEVVPAEFEASIELFVRLLMHLGVARNVVRIQESLIRLGHYRALRGGPVSTSLLDEARHIIRAGLLETVEVLPGSPACERTLGEIEFRARTGATVLNLVRNDQPIPSPDAATRLEPGDLLVLYGSHQAIDRALELLEPREAG